MTANERKINNQWARKGAGSGGHIRWPLLWVVLILGLLPLSGVAETPNARNTRAAAMAARDYTEAQARWQQNRTNTDLAWKYGRACFDAGEFAGHDSYRAHLAEQGIEACREALRYNPLSAPAHYYLALNMGQKARSDKLGALKLVREMETELKTAIALDPKLDYGGPDRSLGLLYRDAPGWPTSIGSKRKAREHLTLATQIAPDYPENWLNLVAACLHWQEKDKARELLPVVSQKLQIARQKFTGPEWEWNWLDWERRWEKIKAKLDYKEPLSVHAERK